MGPELAALNVSCPVNVSTTCTEDGYGYDEPTYQNGAWTHWYLEDALIDHYQRQNVDTHEVFPFAKQNYGATGGDAPMQFDNMPNTPFYIALPAATSRTPTLPAAQGEGGSPYTEATVTTALQGMAWMELERTDWSKGGNPRAQALRAEIDSPELIASLIEALEPRQLLLNSAARCLFSYSLTFRDADGARLGQVGICEGPSYGTNHEAVFVLDGPAGEPVRMGLIVPDAASLTESLDAQLK